MIKCDRVKSIVSPEKVKKMACRYCRRLLTGISFERQPVSLPLIYNQKLKNDLEFSKSELRAVQAELDATKQKLESLKGPAIVLEIDMFSTIMQQVSAINEKLEKRIDPSVLAKQVIKEVLNPLKTVQKLSKSEQIKQHAAAKTDLDNLKLIQKQAGRSKITRF